MASQEVRGVPVDDVLVLLAVPDDGDLGELVELAATSCGTSMAAITLRRGLECHVPAAYGLDPPISAWAETFCAHAMEADGVFTVEDARQDPAFADLGWANGEVACARFYASAPIHSPVGTVLGRLCVLDPEPRSLTRLQERSLETMAHSVTKLVELRLLQAARVVRTSPEARETTATLVSQLAAELSHDMRVPLSAVLASLEMLEDELAEHPEPIVGALLTRAIRAAHRVGRMLDQNMLVAAHTTGPVYAEVDLGRVVDQLVLDAAPLAEPLLADIVAGDLPVVYADPDAMYSVLQNILTNSLKYSRREVPPRVHITSRRTAGGWRISVQDNGLGIPPDRRGEVFSLFSRVDRGVAGHGIGLATVHRIVVEHGGRVGVEEAAGGGTEIWFELPDRSTRVDDSTEAEVLRTEAPPRGGQ